MDYYNEIKNKLIENEITKKVKEYSINRSDLETYYNVGKLIVKAQGGEKRAKYGDGLIKNYSKRLTKELGRGYSERNLKNMRRFYLFQKGQTLSAQFISWSHYSILFSIEDSKEIAYYINLIKINKLSVRGLRERIKSKEYQRLPKNNNILTNESIKEISDFIKQPIYIKDTGNYEKITEKVLQKLILEDINSFLKELGEGFCYIKNEYPIKIGDRYNYIDLLLFNYIFNCFIVVELKVSELKKEYIGQISTYMNYIDKEVKSINHDKTIGIIIVKKDNCFIMEYCSDRRIIRTTYKII